MPCSVLRARAFALVLLSLSVAEPARAAEQILTLDPAATRIDFVLGATLHRAEGSVRLAQGAIRFDLETGAASGALVVDAASATTGLSSRDANMHADVLESARYPTIVFHPEHVVVRRRDPASADVELGGRLSMHGEERPLVIAARLDARDGRVAIESHFRVPYVEWGMRDYSNFVLRVDRFVDVTVGAEGSLATP